MAYSFESRPLVELRPQRSEGLLDASEPLFDARLPLRDPGVHAWILVSRLNFVEIWLGSVCDSRVWTEYGVRAFKIVL